MKLQDRNILITGSSKGIGRGCAVECARAGANVAINYRSEDGTAQEVAEEIRALGRQALLVRGDVSDPGVIDDLMTQTVAEFGRLDGFVSNAVYSDRELMVEADLAGFRKTIDVTMWGAFYGVRAAARQMIEQGEGGAVTVISSPHAVIPIPTAMAYNMAKAAIDHMSRTAAIELAEHRIRVNVVHPGWIDTPGERKFFTDDQLAEAASGIPWKRMGRPEEIGRLVAFMMSDDCDYMTGSTVLMDGGISLPWWSNRSEGKQ
ncbi:MAG: SDR family NAD(P)-dependent oxidoreductase [Planctomycetota bacterium]|nr:MAG: SDR family NAD(P)-dependent oxidoreductase [Planctomycetota bacterium]REJ86777.1 MAG: SDR family NAD(P)-dependent oxidoreductase [Planctomycetota bacterium]REK20474.1 MAG: SDR family NAD(P)-dependent oxidoreductase [Planctomycetota bacterium]